MALSDEGTVIKYDVLILTCVCHKKTPKNIKKALNGVSV